MGRSSPPARGGPAFDAVVQVPTGEKSVPVPVLREGQAPIAAFVGKGNSGLGALGGRGRGRLTAGRIDVA